MKPLCFTSRFTIFIYSLWAAFLLPENAWGAEGDLDASFGGTGIVITPTDGDYGGLTGGVAVQRDGKILVVGYCSALGIHPDDDYAFEVARYNADGSLDTTFNGTGKVTTNLGPSFDLGRSVAVSGSGAIVVAGISHVGDHNDLAVVRYLSDGSLDTTFNGTGRVTTSFGTINMDHIKVVLQSDGKILVNCPSGGIALVRYNDDGSLDSSFGTDGKVATALLDGKQSDGWDVAIQRDGRILIAGTVSDPATCFALVRYAPDGSLDTSFHGTGFVEEFVYNNGGYSYASSVAVQDDGKIVVGGFNHNLLDDGDSMAVVRYNDDGSADTSFNGTGRAIFSLSNLKEPYANHMALQSDGKILLAGEGAIIPNRSQEYTGLFVVRCSATGSLDTTFNGTGVVTTAVGNHSSWASGIALQSDGRIVIATTAAKFIPTDTDPLTIHWDFAVVRYLADAVSVTTLAPTGITSGGATFHGSVNPRGANTKVRFLYGPAGSPLGSTTDFVSVGSGTSDVSVSATVSGLAAMTNYEYRLDAEAIGVATTNGNVVPFQTLRTPLAAAPDAAFAALGGGAFNIDVLSNDTGDGLAISGLAPGFPENRVAINGDQLNFTPLDLSQADTAPSQESFSYLVRDITQTETTGLVTVYYYSGLKGTYYGNFSEPGGSRVLRLQLDVDYTGLASGRLEWEGEEYPFTIQFDATGHAQLAKARAGDTVVSLLADLRIDPIANTVTGVFRDTGPSPATLTPTLQFLPPVPNFLPAKGMEIAFIDPGEPGTGAGDSAANARPGGIGFTQVRIARKGLARFITKMPDFGAFSAGRQLRPGEVTLPHYSLGNVTYKRAGAGKLGSVSGDAFLGRDNAPTNPLGRIFGALGWLRLQPGGGGENLIALLEGFQYTPGVGGIPSGFTNQNPNARVTLSSGDLPKSYAFDLFLHRQKGRLGASVTDPEVLALDLDLQLDLKAGMFSGSFVFPGTIKRAKIMGGIGIEPPFDNFGAEVEPLLRGSFFVKSTGHTGRITIQKK